MGGMALHDCRLAEMATGEGKTLVAVTIIIIIMIIIIINDIYLLKKF